MTDATAQQLSPFDQHLLDEAGVMIEEGDAESAYVLLNDIRSPGEMPQYYYYLSAANLIIGNEAEAESALSKLYKLTAEDENKLFEFSKVQLGQLLFNRAAAQFNLNEFDSAAAIFEEAAQFWPDSVQVWHNLAISRERSGDSENALHAAERAYFIDQDAEEVLHLKLSLLAAMNRTGDAATLLADAIKKNPDDPKLRITRIRMLLADEQNETAAREVEDLLERFREMPDVYDEIVSINRRMRYPEGELAVTRRKRSAFPGNPEILLELSAIHERMLEWDLARAKMDTLADYNGFEETAFLNKGRIREIQDSLHHAVSAYQSGMDHEPASEKLRIRLAETYNDMEEWGRSATMYEQLADMTDDPEYRLRHAIMIEKSRGLVEAIPNYKKLLELGDPPAYPHYAVARYYLGEGRTVEACTLIESSVLEGYSELRSMRSQIALEMSSPGFNPGAVRDIDRRPQRLEEIRSMVIDSYAALAENCSEDKLDAMNRSMRDRFGTGGEILFLSALGENISGNTAKALAEAERAVRSQPDLADAHRLIAELHELNSEWVEAGRAWSRYLSLKPDENTGYQALIRTYRQSNRLELLIERWTRRYETNPADDLIKKYLTEAMHRAGMYREEADLNRD